jgi:hypothetical protein
MTEWGWIPTVLAGCISRECEKFLIRTHVQRHFENAGRLEVEGVTKNCAAFPFVSM